MDIPGFAENFLLFVNRFSFYPLDKPAAQMYTKACILNVLIDVAVCKSVAILTCIGAAFFIAAE